MKIFDLNTSDRPREKALTCGIESLTDAELLAIIMGSGTAGTNVIEMAQNMLSHCSNKLSVLSHMSVGEMRREFKGIGPAKAITIQAALTLGRRAAKAEDNDQRKPFTSPEIVHNYMWPLLANLDHEEFHVLMLSRSAMLKAQTCVSRGGTAATVVDVKLVIRHALDRMADSIILVHNHPSGTLRPSLQDDKLTEKIVNAARMFDINVRDHIIVTANGYYSYFAEGRLPTGQ